MWDGLAVEFFKVFWSEVNETLIGALNYSYNSGRISISQRREVIKLVPKKNQNLLKLKIGDH